MSYFRYKKWMDASPSWLVATIVIVSYALLALGVVFAIAQALM